MLYLVTGGSGSGKSAFAEDLIVKLHNDKLSGNLYYIATMHSYDEESDKRIERHRTLREGKGFITVEKELILEEEELKIDAGGTCLLEDLSNLLANEMYMGHDREYFAVQEAEEHMRGAENLLCRLFAISRSCTDLVIVSNEIFSDGVQYDKETLYFMKQLGYLNCHLARQADGVIEVVCGIPIWRKGKEEC